MAAGVTATSSGVCLGSAPPQHSCVVGLSVFAGIWSVMSCLNNYMFIGRECLNDRVFGFVEVPIYAKDWKVPETTY